MDFQDGISAEELSAKQRKALTSRRAGFGVGRQEKTAPARTAARAAILAGDARLIRDGSIKTANRRGDPLETVTALALPVECFRSYHARNRLRLLAEWELFGIPGGIQVFLWLNLALVIVVLYGLKALALGYRSGIVCSWVLVAGGAFAAVIHTYFLLQGSEAFRLPSSLVLLGAILVLSVAQAAALLQRDRR